MSAPNETAAEDLRNALTLLYAIEDSAKIGADSVMAPRTALAAARRRVLSALRKIEHAESSAAAT